MRKIAVPAVRAVLAAADDYFALEAEEDSDGEIDDSVADKEVKALMSSLTGMLAEWTDERRIVGLGVDPNQPIGSAPVALTIKPADSLHLALTRDILQRILGAGTSSAAPRDERKYLLSLLAKLHIPSPPAAPGSRAASRAGSVAPGMDDRASVRSTTPMSMAGDPPKEEISADAADLLSAVKDLLDQAIAANVASDAAGRNALVKAKNAVLKLLASSTVSSGNVGGGRRAGLERVESALAGIKEEDEEDAEGYSRASAAPSAAASVAPSRRSSRRSQSILSQSHADDGEGQGEGDDTIIANRRSSVASRVSRSSRAPSVASIASVASRRSSVASSVAPGDNQDGDDTIIARPRTRTRESTRRESVASHASRASIASRRSSVASSAAPGDGDGDGDDTLIAQPRRSSRRESVASVASQASRVSRTSTAAGRVSKVSVPTRRSTRRSVSVAGSEASVVEE